MKRTTAQPGAGLYFSENEPGRNEGIRDIRRNVGLEAIEAKYGARGDANRQVEPVKRKAPDEHTQPDRDAVASGATTFRPDGHGAPPEAEKKRLSVRGHLRSAFHVGRDRHHSVADWFQHAT